MVDLKKILLAKYDADLLAQVYLATYAPHVHPEEWISDFLSPLTKLEDHPDLFWVRRSEKENDYKVDSASIKAMLKFINYRPIELKKRFIFITDAHLLSVIVSNKLLKVLEELPELYCLFLLVPEGQTLLPTVESRSIKVRIPTEVPAEFQKTEFFESAFDVMGHLKTSDDPFHDEKKFIETQLDLMLSKNPTYRQCEDMLANLKHYVKSDEYNNAKVSRLSLLFP